MITEEQVIEKVTPYLKEMCSHRWLNLELEDRIAEMQYAFLAALRYYPINSGHFMEDFKASAEPYMDELNRRTPSLYYNISLDADMAAKNGAENCNRRCFLTARDESESRLYVGMFISSLPKMEQDILGALLSGDAKTEIARDHHMTAGQLQVLLKQIGNQYLSEYGRD